MPGNNVNTDNGIRQVIGNIISNEKHLGCTKIASNINGENTLQVSDITICK